MATNSVSSTSAGLDVPALVEQLMATERRPIDTLNTKISTSQIKISTFGTVKGLAADFQAALQGLNTSLTGFSATPSDTSVVSASADSTAAAGNYSLNVTALAQAHKLAAAGQVSDTTAISTGASTVTFSVGGVSSDITIAAGATLQDIRTAINAANLGVTATVINDGSGTPFRLALSSDASGTSNAINSITIQAGGDAAINDLLAYNPTTNAPTPAIPMAQTVAAQDASFTLNGILITKPSNAVTDAIQGVTLNLSKIGTSDVVIARDTAAVSKAASGLVDTYNALSSKLKTLTAYGNTAGALAGDGTLRMMQDQLRSILNTPATGGTLSTLSEVGIGFQADGTLKLDTAKLNTAMATNFSDVTNLFSSAGGFATRLETWATGVVQPTGLIDQHTDNLNTTINSYNEQIRTLEVKMTALQKQYTKTYTDLNTMLMSMNSTSTYLAQQFASGGN
ncbi:MAG: flagellar filament capping protein FliD [Gammaproteobacteria bacterium]|nr:flagellar filament capping protein FliD [Gammaproteobacteria bacterium]MBU1623780.1 flagellar filament capping protein FliD [Gammaproteobacteria bacterium]MBU1981997.1 flagellar filament capping protein FliD [Gammaproteobacteria bacterium]